MSDALTDGRNLLAELNPNLEAILAARYDAHLPGMAESLVEYQIKQINERPAAPAFNIWPPGSLVAAEDTLPASLP